MHHSLINYVLHIDQYLAHFVHDFGVWAYVALFLVIFFEMGCILTPFLPGDSLLFAAGAIAAAGGMNIYLLMTSLLVATLAGMLINYWIGVLIGHKLFQREQSKFFNPKHLHKTHDFFEKYGGKTIIIACFIPIIRTFAPFVAGMAEMTTRRFVFNAVIGAVLWVVGLLYLSYSFGNIPFIREHFSLVIIGIIVASLVIPFVEVVRKKLFGRNKQLSS